MKRVQLLLALVASGLTSVASAQVLSSQALPSGTPAPAQGRDAPVASVVLTGIAHVAIGGASGGRYGEVSLGGRGDWVPAIPVTVFGSYVRSLGGGGVQQAIELGGGLKLLDRLASGSSRVVEGGYTTRDSVYTYYRGAQVRKRQYVVVRAGLSSLTYGGDPRSSGGPTSSHTGLFVGVSRNVMVNERTGPMGVRTMNTLGVDLLRGSVDSLSRSTSRIGWRVTYASQVWGGVLTPRFELGVRPGMGKYVLGSIDGYWMF